MTVDIFILNSLFHLKDLGVIFFVAVVVVGFFFFLPSFLSLSLTSFLSFFFPYKFSLQFQQGELSAIFFHNLVFVQCHWQKLICASCYPRDSSRSIMMKLIYKCGLWKHLWAWLFEWKAERNGRDLLASSSLSKWMQMQQIENAHPYQKW